MTIKKRYSIILSKPVTATVTGFINEVWEGEPLEIFTDREGEVIFKKYSPIGELGRIAEQYGDALNKTTGLVVAIADRDAVIACSGSGKKDIQDKNISSELERIMEFRRTFLNKPGETTPVRMVDNVDTAVVSVAVPIITEGDLIGSVAILANDENSEPGEIEIKLAQTAAVYLGKHFEN